MIFQYFCRIIFYRKFLHFSFVVFLLGITSCSQPKEQHFQGPIMGTQYKLVLSCETEKSPKQLLAIAVAEMDAINMAMSTYLPDSELSLFNKSERLDWQTISQDLLRVIEIAQSVSVSSNGAFDITISPLIDLWGFGAAKNNQIDIAVPDDEVINNLKALIGYRKIEIDSDKLLWRKQYANLNIDLSAVAKGYAVDKVSLALSSAGCRDHLVDIGGELKLQGKKNKKGDLWRIAIEEPSFSSPASNIQLLLDITDIGVASSGDYRNYYQVNGKRYSHTVDPRTARPIEHGLAAVTVLHEQTAIADAWATAFMVLGDAAPELADQLGLAAYFIFRESIVLSSESTIKDSENTEKYRITTTKQFDKFLTNK